MFSGTLKDTNLSCVIREAAIIFPCIGHSPLIKMSLPTGNVVSPTSTTGGGLSSNAVSLPTTSSAALTISASPR